MLRRATRRAVAAIAVATTCTATPSLAAPPLAQPPAETASGGGLIAGVPFRARDAIVFRDAYGDVHLFLLAKELPCRTVYLRDAPYVWVYIHAGGRPLGRNALPDEKTDVAVNFPLGRRYSSVRAGIQLVLLRLATTPSGTWQGRLTVVRQRVGGATFDYSGTFVARWCGTL